LGDNSRKTAIAMWRYRQMVGVHYLLATISAFSYFIEPSIISFVFQATSLLVSIAVKQVLSPFSVQFKSRGSGMLLMFVCGSTMKTER